ncbi:MAG: hypothetical protein K8R41_06680 [Bacteroidales bacterium]|nr:hypothetical protein [Bacteroidales bacterium]
MKNLQEITTMQRAWIDLYPETSFNKLNDFIKELKKIKVFLKSGISEAGWYKDAIVYSVYVDLFNNDFSGLESKLDYLANLGVNCLWLLPILDSPMRDAGFDIKDYRKIRPELLKNPNDYHLTEFADFVKKAHEKNINVIFDIALNHTSDEHYWFQESRTSPDSPYRDFYIWNKDTDKYKEARIIFEGIEKSNWEKEGNEYYFHRFFNFQPDLNFRNPDVLLEMSQNMLFWLIKGVDGFRADAIPYLWKEKGTDCENLEKNHTIIRFFRAVLDFVKPNTLLLAEACQKPKTVVKYFGDGDECNAGYHFPLMPQIYKSLAMQNSQPIRHTLSPAVTPGIPESAQWLVFLRCHDELSLEYVYVNEEDRKYIHDNYCKKPEWDFRLGQGISARLAELLDRDEKKIGLAYSIMLTLPGTPVIYYGDEFGKLNDDKYYKKMIKMTGKDDTRFLVRGKIDWKKFEGELKNKESFSSKVFAQLSNQIKTRKNKTTFGRDEIQWLDFKDEKGIVLHEVLAYYRINNKEKILIINNLSEKEISVKLPIIKMPDRDILGQAFNYNKQEKTLFLSGFSYYWIKV